MHSFKDNFSIQSALYAKYRPHYPSGLFAFLSSLTGGHELAWDCGTGNGQAADGLTAFYNQVIATDPSAQQIKQAKPNSKVNYLVEKAEETSLQSGSVDLLTIANALHWFDFDVFYKEAYRVLKDDGVIAAWSYSLLSINPEIDVVLKHFHDDTLHEYWQPENRLVEKGYTTIPFPFREINAPLFVCGRNFTLHDLIGYLNTWSATHRFINKNNFNPTDALFKELGSLWGDANTARQAQWVLNMKIGSKLQS